MPPRLPEPQDPRLTRLQQFFREHECPVEPLSKEFLDAADEHGLDWRLLPSIALLESGGGRDYLHNNLFGWGGGLHRFESETHGIRHVAERLSKSPLYRGKPLAQVLTTYNPVGNYAERVQDTMRRLGPSGYQ